MPKSSNLVRIFTNIESTDLIRLLNSLSQQPILSVLIQENNFHKICSSQRRLPKWNRRLFWNFLKHLKVLPWEIVQTKQAVSALFRSVALFSNHSNTNMFFCKFFDLYYQFFSAHIISKRRHFWRCLFRFISSTEFISVSTNQISDVVSLIHIPFNLVRVIMLLGHSNGVNLLKKIY